MSVALLFVASLVLVRSQTTPSPAVDAHRETSRSCRVLVGAWLVLAVIGLGIQQLVDARVPGRVDDFAGHAVAATLVTMTVAGAVWFALRCRAVSAGIGPRVGWWDDSVILVVAVAWNASLLAETVVALSHG